MHKGQSPKGDQMAQDINIKVNVDSSGANQGLQQIGKNLDAVAESTQGAVNDLRKGLDGVEQSAKKVVKEWPKVTDAAKKVGQGANGASKGTDALSDSLNKNAENAGQAASIFGALGGAISVVSPKVGAAVTSLGAMASGLEAVHKSQKAMKMSSINFASVLGPVALAAAAAGLAFKHYSDELDEAEEKMRLATERAQTMATVFGSLKTDRARVALELDVAAGIKPAEELVKFNAEQRAAAAFSAARGEAIKEVTAAQEKLTAATDQEQKHLDLLAESKSWIVMTNSRRASIKQAETQLEQAKALRVVAEKGVQNAKDLTQTLVKQEKDYSDAIRARAALLAKANKKGGSGSRAKAEAAKALKALNEEAAARAALLAIERQGQIASLTGEEKINEIYKDKVAALDEIAAGHAVAAELEKAKHETEKMRIKEIDDLRARQREDALAAVQEERQKRKDAHDQRITEEQELNTAIRMGLQDLTGNTADLMNQLSENIGGTNKEQARALFNVAKGLTVAKIGFATAEGLIQGAAKGPPLGPIQIGAVLAQSAASLAMVAAQKPSFHTGSSFVNATGQRRELNAKLRAGEAVSTPLGAEILGRGNIERANAGMSGGSGDRPVVFQYEHRMFSRFIRDNVRMRGPISTELNRGKHTGHRG